MLEFTLEIIIILIFFRYVLGYSMRTYRGLMVICIGLIMTCYLAYLILTDITFYNLQWLWVTAEILIPMLCFEGKQLNTLALSLSARSLLTIMETFGLGISMVISRGDSINLDFSLCYILMLILFGVLLLFFSYWNREKRETLCRQLEEINVVYLLAYVLFVQVLARNDWYFGYSASLMKKGFIGVGVTSIFVLLICMLCQRKELRYMLELNNRCMREQTEQYQLLSTRDYELRKFRHDYNDHLDVMHTLAVSEQDEVLRDYVIQMKQMGEGVNYISTNHIICDALVNRYAELCKEAGVRFSVVGKFPIKFDTNETDLCVLISNGLRNAYEAARKCNENKFLLFEIKYGDAMVVISITNPVNESPVIKNGLFQSNKGDKRSHGYGVRNMVDAAKRIGGSVTWTYKEEGVVVTEMVM